MRPKVIIILINFLQNHPKVINKLADSKPMRFAAKTIVRFINKKGMLEQSSKILDNPQEIIPLLKKIVQKSIKKD